MKYNWRYGIMYAAHVIPTVALIFEMSMNRLRIPVHHIIYNMVFVGFYIFITYAYQILNNFEAIFFNSLNWKCEKNYNFAVNTTAGVNSIPEDSVSNLNCNQIYNIWPEKDGFQCHPLYPYDCPNSQP